jgi:hypothetical protein
MPAAAGEAPAVGERSADGYRGIWYMVQPTKDEYRFKYSGGMATYSQWHVPIAIYAPAVDRTFFCFGGVDAEHPRSLLHMVSYFDHATGTVPRPTVLLDKATDDAHDNPTLAIAGDGHLWVFSNAHGTSRPAYIHRSREPYSITGFERVFTGNFSYGQPWWLPGRGFLFMHTRYGAKGEHFLYHQASPDGRAWSPPAPLATMATGSYQISGRCGDRVATVFDVHPDGLNTRTNLYYLESADGGATWTTAAGASAQLPLTELANPALVHDYRAERLLVYLKDLAFDADGRPVVLFLTSRGSAPGPASAPFTWRTARWTGSAWTIRDVTTSDHDYDHGPLFIEGDGTWRVIAPTDPGPQPYAAGGEVVMWTSRDQGATWTADRRLTAGSARNHTYVRRPVDARPDFYALWSDGDGRRESPVSLFFCDRAGEVWRLPTTMTGPTAKPEPWPQR